MIVKFWLKSGAVIVLDRVEKIDVTRNTVDDAFTALTWKYNNEHTDKDAKLLGICLSEVAAVTTEDR